MLINRLIRFSDLSGIHLFFLAGIVIFFVNTQVTAQDTPQHPDSMTVSGIHVYGNKVTKENTIRMYMRIHCGDTLDSLKIATAKKRLLRTKLFSKVNIFTMKKNDGMHLYVVVTEHFFIIPDAGGSYYTKKYNNNQLWFRFSASLAHRNLGGRGENAKIAATIWDSRGLLLSWTKPLLPSDFYLISALAMDFTPDQVKSYNTTRASGKLVIGKDLFENSKIAAGLFPSWNKLQKIDSAHIKTTELYSSVGWITDRRNNLFNPSRGMYLYADVGSNYLYNKGVTRPYVQTTSELRLFYPGFFKENVIAARIEMILRNTDAGPIHYLSLGGVKSIRGYPNAAVGSDIRGNNYLNLSCEYRFPLFRLPLLTIPVLSSYNNRFESVDIRIHGALIGDFGRVAYSMCDLFDLKSHNVQSGSGLGGGIRVLAPDFETNGCIDIVFPQFFRLPRGILRYYNRPFVHLYLNFPY